MKKGEVKEIDLDVTGVQTLRLFADDNGDNAYKWANWVDAQFVKTMAINGQTGADDNIGSIDGQSIMYLSDLYWKTEEFSYVKANRDKNSGDKSNSGVTMSVGGKTYKKGIGAHATSHITITLSKKYHRLKAIAGIDDAVAAKAGQVNFKVYADDVQIFYSGAMGKGETKLVDLDITGVQTLKLSVTAASSNDFNYANWADAMLIKNVVVGGQADDTDSNPFRYCGEYFDTETGNIYLRARYYDPNNGRFISGDTHWNVNNMIYGDDPLQLNEYTDVPNIHAIMQSGNLYVYCMYNPVNYFDSEGKFASGTRLLHFGITGSKGSIMGYAWSTVWGFIYPDMYITITLYQDGVKVVSESGRNDLTVSVSTNNKTSYWYMELEVGSGGEVQSWTSSEVLFNRTGNPYPKYTDPKSGMSVFEPPINLSKVQNPLIFTRNHRISYKKWYEDTYNDGKEFNWEKYEIHHIIPLAYGGTNDRSNLIVLPKKVHYQFSGWWNGY